MNAACSGPDLRIRRTFSLENTFDCGQCFRFEAGADGKWRGVAFGRELCLYEDGGEIVFENVSEEEFRLVWADYFDLDFDYDAFWETACGDETLLRIVRACAPERENALHILRQEPFEAICSFLISQNNNIPRIRRIIRAFCENFGARIGAGEAFAFPAAEKVARLSEEDLAPLRCGYRAKYLIDAARKIAGGEIVLPEIAAMELPRAREELRKILGVGPKVADCALLYGFHRMAAFPVDVWIRRAMARFFPGRDPACFGEYAGLSQQYLFAYARSFAFSL